MARLLPCRLGTLLEAGFPVEMVEESKEDDDDREGAMNGDCELAVIVVDGNEPEVGPTPPYDGEDDTAIALLEAVP